jgi:hypothetical protein
LTGAFIGASIILLAYIISLILINAVWKLKSFYFLFFL